MVKTILPEAGCLGLHHPTPKWPSSAHWGCCSDCVHLKYSYCLVQGDVLTWERFPRYFPLQWRHMKVMKSQIAGNLNVCLATYADSHQRNTKARITGRLWGEFNGNRWIPGTKGKEKASIWWRHHAFCKGNPPMYSPQKGRVMQIFDIFFAVNRKRLLITGHLLVIWDTIMLMSFHCNGV